MKSTHFIGVDVSKRTLDFALLDQSGSTRMQIKISNDEKSISTFFDQLRKDDSTFSFDSTIICLEHTGIYANILLNYLVLGSANICLEAALQIQRSQGMQRGKNDKVDALRIAQYCFKNQQGLRFWAPTRPQLQKLKALLSMRDRLIRARNQLEVPLKEGRGFTDPSIQKMLVATNRGAIKAIKKSIETVDYKIDRLIHEDLLLKKQFDLITSVNGIGPIIAANMMVTTNEFKTITEAKKFACYSGVAPFEHTSGSSVRGKTKVSKLANMTMKKLLSMGAVSAIQHSGELKAYYERKVAAGKKPMSVINAVRNKLISRVFACIRDQRHYEKTYVTVLA
jgi:transposase